MYIYIRYIERYVCKRAIYDLYMININTHIYVWYDMMIVHSNVNSKHKSQQLQSIAEEI